MPTVAEQLRAAREKLQLSVHQVAESTNIRTDHIRAIEESRYEVFAAPVYIKGFVRTYGSMLKLNVPALVEQLETELGQVGGLHQTPGVTGRKGGALDFLMLQLSKVNWRFWLVFIALLVLGGIGYSSYVLWKQNSKTDPLNKLGPGLYQPKHTNTGSVLPVPPAKR